MRDNNIICSIQSNDFIILYDGLGTYFVYHENDLILEVQEAINPVKLHDENNLLDTVANIKKNAKYNPHKTKFQLAPCQIPVARKTINRLIYVLCTQIRLPPSGIYKYSLNQVDKDICHLRHNSVIDFEIYG